MLAPEFFKLPTNGGNHVEQIADDADTAWCELHAQQVHTIAAACDGSVPLPALRCPDGPLAVFMGSEAFGLPASLLASVDRRTHIPMAAGVDSYSVNAAAAIILYELCVRQTLTARTRGHLPPYRN